MSQKAEAFWSQRSFSDTEFATSQPRVAHAIHSPCPVTPLLDVVHRPAAGDDIDVLKRGQAARRSVAEMQLEMYNKGAFFFKFEEPRERLTGDPIKKDMAYQQGVQEYRTMEEKGYLVSSDGCIFPHDQYGIKGAGSTKKGYHRSTFFLCGLMPEKASTGKKGKRSNKTIRDKDGWPMDSHISHLCHRNGCIRGDHLQIEPRVVNLRRNYCGILNTGSCDCGMVPPCVRKYHPAEWNDPDMTYCKTRQEVLEVLGPLQQVHSFKLLDREQIRVDAIKSENDRRRKAAGAKTASKTAKNLRKRQIDSNTQPKLKFPKH